MSLRVLSFRLDAFPYLEIVNFVAEIQTALILHQQTQAAAVRALQRYGKYLIYATEGAAQPIVHVNQRPVLRHRSQYGRVRDGRRQGRLVEDKSLIHREGLEGIGLVRGRPDHRERRSAVEQFLYRFQQHRAIIALRRYGWQGHVRQRQIL